VSSGKGNGKDWLTPTRLVGGGLAVVIIGILAVQFILALGPSSRTDRMSPCRALSPTASNTAYGAFPARAVEFSAPDKDGRMVSLSHFRGKVVFVNFWQSQCRPCIEEMPSMDKLARKLTGKPFAMVALASEPSYSQIERFFRGREPAMSVLLDPPGEDTPVGDVSLRYGTEKWPETYLIDKQGVVRYYYVNKRDWGNANAERCIKALMEE
jgi:peroxiredoxin